MTQEDYDAITAGMDVVEEYNVFDFFSDTIPTAEELANIIGVGNPELAAAILAVQIAQDLFNVVGDSYC